MSKLLKQCGMGAEGEDEEAVDAGDCAGAESPPEAAESDPSSEEE